MTERPLPTEAYRRAWCTVAGRALLSFAIVLLGPLSALTEAPKPKANTMNLAFVLLSVPALPKGEDVERAFAAYAAKGQTLRLSPSKAKKGGGETLEFDTLGGGYALVSLMPAPVPNREADEAARYSVSALGGQWKLPLHKAHLVVVSQGGGSPLESLGTFTSILAAVVEASSAVGVYCGNAGATHDPKFFRELAREHDVRSRLPLWSGVSIAGEPDGRLSLLSLGMKRLELPDLLLVAPGRKADEALPMLYDLLAYVVARGRPLADGDTVGRSAAEKLPVHYVPSPADPKVKVWRVELK
jgi:Domain of unknown function (DUF4261)